MLSEQINLLPCDWLELLKPYLISERGKRTIAQLDDFLMSQVGCFHPNQHMMFAPFHSISVQKIKVVIVGHFPYPKASHTTGLPFSNPTQTSMSLSVANIYKSMINDVGGAMPPHGNLEYLPSQGVFLLNRKFTTGSPYKTFPTGHTDVGWENFSAAIIYLIAQKLDRLVFMLWGKPAAETCKWIDKRHLGSSINSSLIFSNKSDKPLFNL